MNILRLRAITSTLLIISFLIVLTTGIGLYLAPNGRIARETNWRFLSFQKFQLENLHTLTGFIMAFLVIVHFFINYKLYSAEIKSLKSNNTNKPKEHQQQENKQN